MPVYEYHCSACGHRIDILHGFDESGPKFCPACGVEGTMRKAFAPPTIVFKGSGWAKKERHSAASKKSSSRDGDSAAPASPPESKPAGSGEPEKAKPAASSGTD